MISGILSSKANVVRVPLLTETGIARLLLPEQTAQSMLIQLDGKTAINQVINHITLKYPNAMIQVDASGYETVQQSLTMSDSLVISLRGLILAITATSLGVLFYLSQRDGAYQIGVLRAIGVKKPWLLLPAILQTLVSFVVGFLVIVIILPIVSQKLGLEASRILLMRTLYRDMGRYLVIGIASTVFVTLQFLAQPIPLLMKDAW
ncbi:MAG: hypothetical protein LLG09_03070 [Negativicutes bacterium]|nr:hypothetical protein [Negativicutes bacterium]